MKKIIILAVFILTIGVCNINASQSGYNVFQYRVANIYEVNEEFDPEVDKFIYKYICDDGERGGLIEGNVESYIDTSKLGTFQTIVNLYYYNECTESMVSSSQKINIYVRDTTKPVIDGVKNYVIEYGSKIPDFTAGINYYDNYSNNVEFYVDYSDVDATKLGEYTVYYTAIDEVGNKTEETSSVIITDTTKPSLSTTKTVTVNVNDYKYDFRKDATASDLYEGDISSRIIIDYMDLDIHTLGTYQIEYSISDLSGNKTSAIVNVDIIDREKPTINSVKEISIELRTDLDEVDFIGNITVSDNYDTSLVLNYDITRVNIDVIGSYVITYYTKDASGNIATVDTYLHVVDTTRPLIEIIDKNIVVLVGDNTYDFLKHFSASDNYTENPIITVDTRYVNFDTLGEYPITITATDTYGNISQVTVNIIVEGVIDDPIDSEDTNNYEDVDDKEGTRDNTKVNYDNYESNSIAKIAKSLLVLVIPVTAFLVTKSYLLKGH